MISTATHTVIVTSDSFERNEYIPKKYSCQGDNINPFINYSNFPSETKTIALIMDDPDAPGGIFTHWIMWNIDADQAIQENSQPGIQGKNSKNEIGYTGPCPPSGTHHYHFKIFALDKKLDLPEGSSRSDLENAIHGHILAWGELIGLYRKTV